MSVYKSNSFKRWTSKELMKLAEMFYDGYSMNIIAESLGRTVNSCQSKLLILRFMAKHDDKSRYKFLLYINRKIYHKGKFN